MFKTLNQYPYRWAVKLVEVALIMGIIFFGLDAMQQFTISEPTPYISYTVETLDDNSLSFTAMDYYYFGVEHHERNQYEEAIEDYTRVLELDPNFASAYLNRGVAYEQRNEDGYAMTDFDGWLNRDSMIVIDRGSIRSGETINAYMSENTVLEYEFYASAGSTITVRVESVNTDEVDPLIMVVDGDGYPVAASDDIRLQDGTLVSMDSFINGHTILRSGSYTLRVSHAGGGDTGDISISFDLAK